MVILLLAMLTRPEIVIPRVESPPHVEQFVNGDRSDMLKVEGFKQRERNDGEPSTRKTEVYLGYDNTNFYAAFVCEEPGKVRAQLLNRGNTAIYSDDIVTVQLDTFNDQRRAYQFVSNALGVQQDAIWFENSGSFDYSFDTVFHTEARITKNGYIVFFAIPFRSLRFPAGPNQTWGILLTRYIPGADEQTYWPQYSIKIAGRLNQTALLNGLTNISPGRNMQILPYAALRSFRTIDRNSSLPFVEEPEENDFGVDSKFVIRDSLVVDLTANPDFSQVESDDPQVTVNQRFEVLFPEKRPFFLENASFFETPINLLFTRRIADPQFGARVTGKMGSYSIGALFADDQSPGKVVSKNHPFADKRATFSAIRLSRDVGKQSSIGLLYTDRQFSDGSNRVGGLDARFRLGANWTTALQAVASTTQSPDGSREAGPAYRVNLNRSGRQFNANVDYFDFSAGFHSLSGFVNRTDIRRFDQQISYSFRPERKYLFAVTPHLDMQYIYDHRRNRLDAWQNPWLSLDIAGQTFIGFGYTFFRTRVTPKEFPALTQPVDIPRREWGMSFNTEAIPGVSIASFLQFGRSVNFLPPPGKAPASAGFINGTLTLTVRPTNFLTIDNTYILNRLTDPDTSTAIFNNHILRTKWNYQITRRLSLRLIVQYDSLLANKELTSANKTKNLNADLLLAYIVQPGTALFVGYNSNFQDEFVQDSKQLFVKYSHLFRF